MDTIDTNQGKVKLWLMLGMVLALLIVLGATQWNNVQSADNTPSAVTVHSRLIVELEGAPAAVWAQSARGALDANGKLDTDSAEVAQYISALEAQQAVFVSQMATALPQASVATYLNENSAELQATYQVALNGVAVDVTGLSVAEARRTLSKLPGVKNVFIDQQYHPTTYTSTALINAPVLWETLGGQAEAGKGVKIASFDGGLHHEAAMFSGEGWSYPQGWPQGGLGDTSNNNGKIIASRVYFRPWDPPSAGDENSWPGTNGTGHGVHTGATAGGNVVDGATYYGATLPRMSGVAPGAWLMSYRLFYASVNEDGSFYTVEALAAIEDMVMDGADVMNNSWGGGATSAGGEFDALDQALINTSNAGVFVVMSEGNSGPEWGSGDHPSDDYINVAASTTGGTYASGELNVIAPTPISDTLQGIAYGTADFGKQLEPGFVLTYPITSALAIDPANELGCAAWDETVSFEGKAVLIARGSCFFSDKVRNAQNAGAGAVVVYNSVAGGDSFINMGCGAGGTCEDITIPAVMIGRSFGLGMINWANSYPETARLEFNTLAKQVGSDPDRIASFSSRGPSVSGQLKPDIAAPGVNIMSQGYGSEAGEASHLGYGQVSGTSMAAPHVTGAAALLRAIHPDWSNDAIKSAMMSTAKYMEIYTHDGRPAQPLDMGAGRLDLTHAADPGVILDPPSLSFSYMLTGTKKTLNVAIKSVSTMTETYQLTTLYTGEGFTATTALAGFTVSPTSLTLAPGGMATVQVMFDSARGMGLGDNQGYVVMKGAKYEAHFPVWARTMPPMASADLLIIDADGSPTFDNPDYLAYYTAALDKLGKSYEVWDADMVALMAVINDENIAMTIPTAAELSAYKAILLFTGDNFRPDGSLGVTTPLGDADQAALTEYANQGGFVIVMGQDASSVMGANDGSIEDPETLFFDYILGGDSDVLQDSVSGETVPTDPIVGVSNLPPSWTGLTIDLSARVQSEVMLSPSNEVPPATALSTGQAIFSYDKVNQRLSYDVTIMADPTQPITLTGAHIHTGTLGTNGGVLYNLAPITQPMMITDTYNFLGTVVITDAHVIPLLSGGLYLNIHTTANPSGELRGQVSVTASADGAGNQAYIDELDPFYGKDYSYPTAGGEEDFSYMPLLRYPDPTNIDEGVVAMAHRAQPSLETPGITYFGRSIYASFGLEGVNNGTIHATRAELLGAFFDWGMDEPTVTISHTLDVMAGQAFEATVTSTLTETKGWTYRWDWGDGSPYTVAIASSGSMHDYADCGKYTVRVEAKNSWGNVAIGSQEITVTECSAEGTMAEGYMIYLPIILK